MNKLRARDDLRHNLVNLCTSVIAPITLPTWDHIAQLSKDCFRADAKCTFLKADRDSAYKQLPLDPDFAGPAVETPRDPTSSKRRAFFPRALLFGAVTAVLHYNCFARALAVIINLTLGIPALNYFGDFGALVREPNGAAALWMAENTSLTLGAPMETIKSLVDTQLTFLGLLGSVPDPEKGLILRAELPMEKITKWSSITREHITDGRITSKRLEKLIGKMSFTQTSVFGRFCRALLIPLRDKLNLRPYTSHVARSVEIKPKFPQFAIYTDAATSTGITAALVFNNEIPSDHPAIDELRGETSPPLWGATFDSATYIYGLEMLAVVGILLFLGAGLRNKTVVFYIDNSNCRDALARGYTNTKVIDSLVQIFLAQVNRLGIFAWFELTPSDPNPSDAPTRFVLLPFPIHLAR